MASQVISTQEFQSYVFASYENNFSNFQSIWTEAAQKDGLLWECLKRWELTFAKPLRQAMFLESTSMHGDKTGRKVWTFET